MALWVIIVAVVVGVIIVVAITKIIKDKGFLEFVDSDGY